jgi:hypothetical protein
MLSISALVDFSSTPLEHTIVCLRVGLIKASYPLQEVLRTSLLKEAHERALQGLGCIRGHLCDRGFRSVALLDIAACDLLELEVSCDVGGDEDIGELAVAHQELGDEVDVPVVDAAVLLPGLGALLVVSVPLEEGLEVDGGRLSAIMVFAVYVQTSSYLVSNAFHSCSEMTYTFLPLTESTPESTHSVRPVPRTTTSYSGAISSMIVVG